MRHVVFPVNYWDFLCFLAILEHRFRKFREAFQNPNTSPTYPIGSMGLVYLPTFALKIDKHVGKYTSPIGSYGYGPVYLPRFAININHPCR